MRNICLILCMIVTTVAANATENFKSHEVREFEVIPLFCVIGRQEQVCGLEIKVKWRMEQSMPLCIAIRHSETEKSIKQQCWQQAQQSQQIKMSVELTRSVDVDLLKSPEQQLLARYHLPLYVEKQINHRNRSPWEFF